MVSIAPPHESGKFGNGRNTGRSDGQNPADKRQPAEAERMRPAASGVGVTVRLSNAVDAAAGGDSVRGASRGDNGREPLSGPAADLDRNSGGFTSAVEALEESREALAHALEAGDAGTIAAAALRLSGARQQVDADDAGFAFRASRVIEKSTVAFDHESGRYLPSTRRVALSIEVDARTALVHDVRPDAAQQGVSVIHEDPPVPIGGRPPQAGQGLHSVPEASPTPAVSARGDGMRRS